MGPTNNYLFARSLSAAMDEPNVNQCFDITTDLRKNEDSKILND